MAREIEPGDRVRCLDPEHRGLFGTVDDVGGSDPDGVSVVEVTWDDGRRERRLGEEVALVELFVRCLAPDVTALEQCLEWAALPLRDGETLRHVDLSHYGSVSHRGAEYYGVSLWVHRGKEATPAMGYGDTAEEAARAALRVAEREGLLGPAPERVGTVAQRVLDELETADPQREAAQ